MQSEGDTGRSDHFLTRVHGRFRHVCIWRGVLLATVAIVIGAHAVLAQRTLIIGRHGPLHWIEGRYAVAVGIAWLGLALALNSHYFWGRVEPTWRFADLGMIVGVIIMTASIIYGVMGMLYTGWVEFAPSRPRREHPALRDKSLIHYHALHATAHLSHCRRIAWTDADRPSGRHAGRAGD